MLTVAAAALLSSALAGPRAHPRVHARMSTDAAAASAWVGVPSALCERLCAAGFVRPMPIQQAAMALIAGGENAVLHAATGSGKTLAYLVPLLSRIEPGSSGLFAVIVSPSQELAIQIATEAQRLLPMEQVW